MAWTKADDSAQADYEAQQALLPVVELEPQDFPPPGDNPIELVVDRSIYGRRVGCHCGYDPCGHGNHRTVVRPPDGNIENSIRVQVCRCTVTHRCWEGRTPEDWPPDYLALQRPFVLPEDERTGPFTYKVRTDASIFRKFVHPFDWGKGEK